MQDKVIVIAGGAGDIGAAVAAEALARGARVYVLDRQKRQSVSALSDEAIFIEVDLSSPALCQKALQQVIDEAGRIDACVAACGQLLLAPIDKISAADLEQCFAANVYANFFVVQAVLPFMRQANYGRMVVLTSDQALHGRAQGTVYGMTKAAMAQLVKSVTADLRGGGDIRINALALGTVADTQMTEQAAATLALANNQSVQDTLHDFANEQPTAAFVDLKEVAAMVCYLCSPQSSGFAGSVLTMDGGLTAVR